MAALKKEDFTEEQWKEIEAEQDRRATNAAETARKNAEKKAQEDVDQRIADAVAAERAKLEATEAERLEMQRKELDEREAKINAEHKAFTAKTKLLSAGYSDEDADGLVPLFVNLDEKSFEPTIDNYIKVTADSVKKQVDAEKQALLAAATPPAGPTGGPVDAGTAVVEMVEQGNDAGAIDLMLDAAGYTTPTT